MILGDFNAHHTYWGSTFCSNRGHTILNLTDELNLHILNQNSPTFICSSTGSLSSIDLSICSQSLIHKIQWDILEDTYGSDHFPILIRDSSPYPHHSPAERFNFNKADWTGYVANLNPPINNITDINSYLEEITTDILQAASSTIPRYKLNKTPVPWWTRACYVAIKERKKALNLFKRHPSNENFINFKKKRAASKKIIKQAKIDSWNKFVSNINASTPSSEVWRSIRKMKGATPRTVPGLLINNTWNSDPEAICNSFADFYQNIQQPSHHTNNFNQIHPEELDSPNIQHYNLPFTLSEFQTSLSKSKDTAPGPDGLHTKLIRNLPQHYKHKILDYYNHLWITDTFPTSWRQTTVIPIHKPGKPRNQPSSYRPITLTSQLCKIMERMVKNRLEWILESKNLLGNNQYGFRKHHSALEQLAHIDSEIRKSLHRNFHFLAVSLDLKNAFDTTNTNIIMNQIKKIGLTGHLSKFILNFLKPRSFKVKINNYFSNICELKSGIPQGSVLSPTLFLLAIQTIEEQIPTNTSLKLFADDILIYSYSTENSYITNNLQSTLNKLTDWSRQTGFLFSPLKSSVTHFCRKRGCSKTNILSLANTTIPMKDSVRLLGLVFDCKLSWKNHINYLKEKTKKDLYLMRHLSNTTWGADFPSLINLYKSIILSKLNYGDFIYDAASPSLKKTLEVIQNQAIRLSTGVYRTTPISSLQAVASILPLSLQRQLSLMRFYSISLFRTHVTRSLDLQNIHSKSYSPKTIHSRIKTFVSTQDIKFNSPVTSKYQIFPPWTIQPPKIDLSLAIYKKESTSPILLKSLFTQIIREKYKNFTHYYTDGSKSNMGTGAAVISHVSITKYKLNKITSIFTAELMAIREAIRLAITNKNKNILIISDSLSSLQSIKASKTSIPIILDIMDLIQICNIRHIQIEFLWSPSHVNIRGNDLADINAKAAIISGKIENKILSPSDLISHFNKTIKNMFQLSWDLQDENKLWESKSDIYPPLHLQGLNRRENVIWRRMAVGHTHLTHAYLLKNEPIPICQIHQTTLTIKHILTHDYIHLRAKYNLKRPLNEILAPNKENIQSLIKFLKEADLYSKI